MGIDPYHAGLDLVADATGLFEVIRPYGCSETHASVVCSFDDGGFVFPCQQWDNGAWFFVRYLILGLKYSFMECALFLLEGRITYQMVPLQQFWNPLGGYQ